MNCTRCMKLEAQLRVLEEELEEMRAQHNQTLDLLMSGEAIRHRMMLAAIFNHPVHP